MSSEYFRRSPESSAPRHGVQVRAQAVGLGVGDPLGRLARDQCLERPSGTR